MARVVGKGRGPGRREAMRVAGRAELDGLFAEFELVDWEQRDVMRDFMVEQSVSNTPGIIRRFEVYLRKELRNDGKEEVEVRGEGSKAPGCI